MYGQYGNYQNGFSGAEDSSLSGTFSFPGAYSATKKKKVIPLHLRPRHKSTTANNLKPLFPIATSPEYENPLTSIECQIDLPNTTSENSNSEELAVMNTSFIENSLDDIKEDEDERGMELPDSSGNLSETETSRPFPEPNPGHVANIAEDTVQDMYNIHNYDPLQELLPSQKVQHPHGESVPTDSINKLLENADKKSEVPSGNNIRSVEVIKEEILNFHRITQASSLYIDCRREKNEMAPLINEAPKSGRPCVLQDIINKRDSLNSKLKSCDVKGTPRYSSQNEVDYVPMSNGNKENAAHCMASRLDLLNKFTPAKKNIQHNSDFELDLKALYQTPGFVKQKEKKMVDLYAPLNFNVYQTPSQKNGEIEKQKGKINDFQAPFCLQGIKENVSSTEKMTDKRKLYSGDLHYQPEKVNKKLELENPLEAVNIERQDLQKEDPPPIKNRLDKVANSGNHSTLSDLEDTNDLLSCGERSLSVNTIINRKDTKETYQHVQNKFPSKQKAVSQQRSTSGNEVQKNTAEPCTRKTQNISLCRQGEKIQNGVNKQHFELKYKARPQEQKLNTENYLTINGKKYLVQCILGRGGSSKVFQVLEPKTAQHLAVKQVDLSVAEPTIAQGYLNEIALLRQLQGSESVIKMTDYEYVEEKQLLYVAMEKGETDLSKLIKDITKSNQIPMTSIVHYWTEMLRAVKNIHEKGVIHSDLKPANFLLVCGRLKLIDFGIASSVQSDMTSVCKDAPAGTYNYISPEALQATSNQANERVIKISYRSDIWSLGCILYNLIYGRTPFQHIVQIWAKLAAITNKDHHIDYPTTRKDCPPILLKAVKQCLTFDPKKRPTAAELLELPYLNYNEV